MKPLFFKRFGAYLLDFIIVTFIVSIITVGFNSNSGITKKMNELINGMANNELTIEEYSNQLFELNYEYQRSIIPTTIVNVAICIGYFVVFAFLNNGQTLGKKLFRIKVVNKDGKVPNIWNMIGRSICLYGIIIGIVNVVSLYIFDAKIFNYVNTILSYIYYSFIIISMFMVMYKKDNRGLHDIIGRTYVIGEVK